jgi:DNA-binding MarR family transcriptional regulator
MSRFEDEVSIAIDAISQHFKKLHSQSELSHIDMNMRECQILVLLSKEKKSMSELSNYLGLSPATLTAHIESLVKKNLVKREYDKEDRRKTYILLTRKGEELSCEMKGKQKEMAKTMLASLNREEQKKLAELLTKVKEHLKEQ